LGTAVAEQVLRRFTSGGPKDPRTARSRSWAGGAHRLCLRGPDVAGARAGDRAGLQVVEHWNSANTAVFYGKDSELTGADREHQEVSMLALHLLGAQTIIGTDSSVGPAA
jgi:hypothetical protein